MQRNQLMHPIRESVVWCPKESRYKWTDEPESTHSVLCVNCEKEFPMYGGTANSLMQPTIKHRYCGCVWCRDCMKEKKTPFCGKGEAHPQARCLEDSPKHRAWVEFGRTHRSKITAQVKKEGVYVLRGDIYSEMIKRLSAMWKEEKENIRIAEQRQKENAQPLLRRSRRLQKLPAE